MSKYATFSVVCIKMHLSTESMSASPQKHKHYTCFISFPAVSDFNSATPELLPSRMSDGSEIPRAPGHAAHNHQLSLETGGDRWPVTTVGATQWFSDSQPERLQQRPFYISRRMIFHRYFSVEYDGWGSFACMSNIFNGCRRTYLASLKELTFVKLISMLTL